MLLSEKIVKDILEPAPFQIEKDYAHYCVENRIMKENMCKLLDVDDLENVSEIEKKLYDYLNTQDITLMVTYSSSCGTCICQGLSYKTIIYSPVLLDEKHSLERVVSLAHEIGHYMDCKHNYNNNPIDFDAMYDKKINLMELVAWKYARDILNVLGFKEWDYFYTLLNSCLYTYVRNESQLYYSVDNMDELISQYEKFVAGVMDEII